MTTTTRRTFLQATSASLAAAALTSNIHAAAANEKLVVGIIGPGGMGSGHLRNLAARKDVEIAYVCDVDSQRLDKAAQAADKLSGKKPKSVMDMRQVLDDKSVDAVFIATPDHWHAPATLLAVDAGKHVYVEKPCCHNLREGRLMLQAARRNKRIVQTGTQSRSAPYLIEAMELLKSGAIGDILVSKAWNSQLRANIGHKPEENPPANLDYDTWVGPAPMIPYKSNRLHSWWRWAYHFGCGDMGNDGVHDIDIARWGLGVTTHPNRVAAIGGKYFFDDDQEFPDTQTVSFEYDLPGGKKRQLIYEQRIWSPYVQEGYENGNAYYGTKGMMILAKHNGYQLFGEQNKLIKKVDGKLSLDPHHQNFIDCIKNDKTPNADVEIGHYTAALVHLGNIATRLGKVLHFDPAAEKFTNDDQASQMLHRTYREGHWAAPKGV